MKSTAQSPTINVHHLTTADGLADGVIRSIGQDKYGYIWISSLSGVSRFDGYSVKVFHNKPGDSTSYPLGVAHSVCGDRSGNLWFGFDWGLYRFNHDNEHFEKIPGTNYRIFTIVEINNGDVYLITNVGMAILDTKTRKITPLKDKVKNNQALFKFDVFDFGWCGNQLYIATDTGIVVYDSKLNTARLVQAPVIGKERIHIIAVDSTGTVWGAYGAANTELIKTDTSFKSGKLYPSSIFPDPANRNDFLSLYIDRKQRLWLTTPGKGLFIYDARNDKFIQYTDDYRRPNSLSTSHIRLPFHGRDGFIWLASEGYGVDYFNPDNNMFEVLTPIDEQFENSLSSWGRTILEEDDGTLWLGWGGGLVKRAPDNTHTFWHNQTHKPAVLHDNSIRALAKDHNNDILIGTAQGVNRYRKSTGKIESLTIADSVPKHFYWTLFKDSRETIWFGTSRTLYYWKKGEKTARNFRNIPVLANKKIGGVQCIFEDSKKRMWFGSPTWGVYMYDPAKNEVQHFYRSLRVDSTMIGLNPTSITEDLNGVMWISFTTGLTSYDPATGKFTKFSREQGMTSVKLSALRVDKRNRLWIGSTSGLLVLDSSRKNFRTFDINDGLPTLEFNDQESYQLKDGRFAYPTMKGFVLFDPNAYVKTATRAEPYLSSISVFGKPLVTEINTEELKSVRLKPDQNFFSFSMVAINFNNPGQSWFAYKLEGFDKDWIYTRNRVATYTNVPGGSYVFRYKASTDPNNWPEEEKSFTVEVSKRFYKTTWFWILFGGVVTGLLYYLYKSRLRQQQRVFFLRSKAQLLEKEKALVQYESLKQQLNPHFLFNSLTSLGSLIRVDQKGAGDFLDRMSKIYRYILKNRDSETVTLADELKFVEMYIELQRTRFDNSLVVRTNIDDEFLHRKIAPVTLQNLVENAIKHNIIDKETPLVIDFFVENGYLVVKNNLQKKKFVETSNKQGLANMESLYHYLSAKPLIIEEDTQFFTVKIPLI
jgi:ligand-binding sensor domain-containing protein